MTNNDSEQATELRQETRAFRPRARLLKLLGDELIRDATIAVFELVKNAYDAGASSALVEIRDVQDVDRASIVIEDDGSGMDWGTLTEEWLEPGTDFRAEQRASQLSKGREPTGRLPLGEKGVGRFAVDKLGSIMNLVTRSAGQPEIAVTVDWDDFAAEPRAYLSDVGVQIAERSPLVFTGDRTGTRIEVLRLREHWTRGSVRRLHRSVTSICSPFDSPDGFTASLSLDPDPGWTKDLLRPEEVLEDVLHRARGTISGNEVTFTYSFTPPPTLDRVAGRVTGPTTITLKPDKGEDRAPDLSGYRIGPIDFEFNIFDRDQLVLAHVTDKRGLLEFLNHSGGIRVYRDGVRVYDYGEPGVDWLDLGARRVNIPSKRLSNNLILGTISLDLRQSPDLIEKTNREGFVENEAFQAFRSAVLATLHEVEWERNVDKKRIRDTYSRAKQPFAHGLEELRDKIREKGSLDQDIEKILDQIDRDVREVRERLFTAASAGLNLAVVIHEVEKGIDELARAVDENAPFERFVTLTDHLSGLVKGLSFLTRRSGRSKAKASELVRHALFNTTYRLEYHGIEIDNGFETAGTQDFETSCVRRLVIGTLMNLIDNSIYWLDLKGGDDKRIYLGPYVAWSGPAIVVADNGPGFQDSPDLLVEPFLSRKPDGIGLGLYLANEVMASHGGRLHFPDPEELSLPRAYQGAVVALEFGVDK